MLEEGKDYFYITKPKRKENKMITETGFIWSDYGSSFYSIVAIHKRFIFSDREDELAKIADELNSELKCEGAHLYGINETFDYCQDVLWYDQSKKEFGLFLFKQTWG